MKRVDALRFWVAKSIEGQTSFERNLASRNVNILRGKLSDALRPEVPVRVEEPESASPSLPVWLWIILAIAALSLAVYRPAGQDPYRTIPETEVTK